MNKLGIDTGGEQLVVSPISTCHYSLLNCIQVWKPDKWILPYKDHLFPSWALNNLIWCDGELGPTITVVGTILHLIIYDLTNYMLMGSETGCHIRYAA
jgi:hypothetical protein